ncbi:PHP domain-containing protein [Pediococcus pentosaceus]|uniref:PHP domain-containing protein n=1 Tax=Pediococcus pentosaceus TaxID=1255 RepID=UPI002B4BDFFE|nr:PHP domain-containing protein [Pediococcus pentosaceus]MEB3377974.1 PHP domain-containing protein [Pediococcus pentosaceus]
MINYDQHVHTSFSFDSNEKMEDYMKLAGQDFVSTEHLEFNNPEVQNHDSIPDYTKYVAEIERLKKATGKRVHKGIEIGMSAGQADKIKDYLAHHTFDIKLLSFHQDGTKDFGSDIVSHLDPLQVTDQYYQLMWKGINEFHDADVLAHFDYGVRRLSLTSGQFSTTAGVLLTNIFKVAIQNNLAFELNTKSMYKYHNIGLYDYAIEIYKQLGGERYTIGSDAHDAAHYEDHFRDALDMLKAHDIHHINVYRQGAMTVVPIDDIPEDL